MLLFREAKFFLVTRTTVTSRITVITSLAKTCVQTCSLTFFNQLPACPMSRRKKKRSITEDSLTLMSADITASKVKRQAIVCSLQPIGLSGLKRIITLKSGLK